MRGSKEKSDIAECKVMMRKVWKDGFLFCTVFENIG